jgi:serine/threonine protein phosphatase PrpC
MTSPATPCPHCGKEIRIGAKFCPHCGQELTWAGNHQLPTPPSSQPDLSPPGNTAHPPPRSQKTSPGVPMGANSQRRKKSRPNLFERLSKGLDRLDGQVDDLWQGMVGAKATPADTAGTTPPTPSAARTGTNARTVRLAHLPSPMAAGEMIGGTYRILQTYSLHRSNYYRVLSLQCQEGHLNPPSSGDVCSQCHARLPEYLAHETIPQAAGNGSRQALLELSRSGQGTAVAGLLPHYHIFDIQERLYVLTFLPPGTRTVLPALRELPAGPEAAISWTADLAKALLHLHQSGYLFTAEDNGPDFLEPVAVLDGQFAKITDLTTCTPLNQSNQGAIQRDMIFLARALYTFATGDRQHILRPSPQVEAAPPMIRRVINRVRSGEYKDVRALLDDLLNAPPAEAPRSLRQNAGYSTDNGRQRDHNEDFVGRYSFSLVQAPETPEIGLYIVADGMGGHQAGELASKDVVKSVVQHIQDNLNGLQAAPKLKRSTVRLDNVVTPGEVLQQAVQHANQELFKIRKGTGADRGTTITAALVVGDTCAIANVGDSRTYLYHNGELRQLTRDHSLVASLLAAGMIKSEEVRSHPQRNQIFRQLGDRQALDVDIFAATLTAGDRLLLCSDGLWEMVLDAEIMQILQQAPTPQAACDRLIDAANQGGGADNISVILVSLE